MPRISLRQNDWQRAKRRLRAIQRELGATEVQFRASLPAYGMTALATAKRLAPRKTGRLRSHLAYSIVGDDVQLGTDDPISGFYLPFQELGTIYILPRRFIQRAFRVELAVSAFRMDLRRRVSTGQGVPIFRQPRTERVPARTSQVYRCRAAHCRECLHRARLDLMRHHQHHLRRRHRASRCRRIHYLKYHCLKR